jgi:hypothetical protein
MGWSFRKRVKLLPGIWLNFSKSGISTTIGTKGASVNFGKRGVYGNVGIPGTGLYKREKLSGNYDKRPKQRKVHVQQEQHSNQPQRVKIATLLQFRDVIEPATLANLLSYQAQGKDFVYVESGIVEKLRSLHIDKKNGKNINNTTYSQPKPQGAPITGSILGALFLGFLTWFTFDSSKYGIISCIIALPIFLILTTRQQQK